MELTGKSKDYFSVFDDSISSMKDLQADAESSQDPFFLHDLHVYNLIIEYWRGNYVAAEEHSRNAAAGQHVFPSSAVFPIHRVFFGSLVSFHLYGKLGGDDARLREGKHMLDEMGKWAHIAMNVFGNKWLLLRAEHAAATTSTNGKSKDAEELYKASIKAAEDHGNIHELALAHELLGNYYHEHECQDDAKGCFKKAVVYYTQWGATAVAERVMRNHDLDMAPLIADIDLIESKKHSRQLD
ncbi:hypothetical protein ACHAXR_009431 [Thalassiosira sp. AJA248-18]